MRAVSHLFIARSRAAVFWFMFTLVGPVGAGLYVQSVIAKVRTQPQYVMAGSSELYYLTPELEGESRHQSYIAQTRLAMETMFNRNPAGLDNHERRLKLFSMAANQQINAIVLKPYVQTFADCQFHQKVGVERVTVNLGEGFSAVTVGHGVLLRTGLSDGQVVNEIWEVQVMLTWDQHTAVRDRGMFPYLCTSVKVLKMERTSL